MSKILTPDIVRAELEKDGIPFGLQDEEAWAKLQEDMMGKLDTDSSWAKGHEALILHSDQTKDCYDIYICTDNHDNHLNINEDVYYYEDGIEWSERILEYLQSYGDVWVDPSMWEDFEHDFFTVCTEAYQDLFEKKFDDKKHELLDEQYDEYKE